MEEKQMLLQLLYGRKRENGKGEGNDQVMAEATPACYTFNSLISNLVVELKMPWLHRLTASPGKKPKKCHSDILIKLLKSLQCHQIYGILLQ